MYKGKFIPNFILIINPGTKISIEKIYTSAIIIWWIKIYEMVIFVILKSNIIEN